MSTAAHKYALQMVLKVFGLKFEELELQAKRAQEIILKVEPRELENALKTLLDYRRNQKQNERRMLAIMEHLGIPDPVANEVSTIKEDQ